MPSHSPSPTAPRKPTAAVRVRMPAPDELPAEAAAKRRVRNDLVRPAAFASGAFLGYTFRQPALLELALTHSSLAYESKRDGPRSPGSDNERLEFIGDAVLGLATAEALYRGFPGLREGELTRMRASLVSRRNLAEVAQGIGLGPMLRLGRGEEHSGGQRKPALLADALEAVIAAMYLDGGLNPAAEFIQRHIVEPAAAMLSELLHSDVPFSGGVGDFKSALQERMQASGAGQPQYVLAEESGPDHQKSFRVEVRIPAPDGSLVRLAEAEGSSKKQAQQEAARLAFTRLVADSNAAAANPAGPDAGGAALSNASRQEVVR